MIPLYPSDAQIAAHLFGSGREAVDAWKMLVAATQHRGLPMPDPVTGRRYWPAVRAFLDRRAGLRDHAAPHAVDGQENFDDSPRAQGAA